MERYGGHLLAIGEYDVLQFIVVYIAIINVGAKPSQQLCVTNNVCRAVRPLVNGVALVLVR